MGGKLTAPRLRSQGMTSSTPSSQIREAKGAARNGLLEELGDLLLASAEG
jgi:hypothetical protein